MTKQTGSIGILNVGAGDTKLVFDNSKPDEVAKSAAIVRDMIRRGFVLLIEVGRDDDGPLYRRAHDFDERTAWARQLDAEVQRLGRELLAAAQRHDDAQQDWQAAARIGPERPEVGAPDAARAGRFGGEPSQVRVLLGGPRKERREGGIEVGEERAPVGHPGILADAKMGICSEGAQ